MANLGKLPYEISIWEDTILDNSGNTLPYFREKKIAIIASDTMDSPIMAFDKNLVENINGSAKLTFKLYYKYTDNDGSGLKDNPLIPFMVNERKVKLKYKNKWYEFLIKDIKEDSVSYTFSYTCESAHIVELSKNGFNLEFDAKLNNNQGTATELGQSVLKDTNWQLIDSQGYINETTQRVNIRDDNNNLVRSDCVIQETKEALYEYTSTGAQFYVYTMTVSDSEGTQLSGPTLMNIPNGEKIYVFYSVATTGTSGDIQFIYRSDGQYTTDSERNITNGSYFLIRDSAISRPAASYGYNISLSGITLFTIGNVSEDYRGIRYVISKKTKYDPLTDKYVDIYKDSSDSNKDVYVYTELEYDARENILNCVSNYKDFKSESGWKGGTLAVAGTQPAEVDIVSAPDLITVFQNSINGSPQLANVDNYTPLVRIKYNNGNNIGINSGFWDNRVQIGSYSIGQTYHCILRAKILASEIDPTADELGVLTSYNGTIQVASYDINQNGAYTNINEIMSFTSFSPIQSGQYLHATAQCSHALTEAETKNSRIGIFFKVSDACYIYVEECWIYREVLDENGNPIIATSQPTYDIKINTKYKGYKPSENIDITDKENIKWYCDTSSEEEFISNYSNLKLQSNDNSEKILSITAKESNYFNLIQTICETFECWARFTVLHNADGSVKFEEFPAGSGVYRPCKYVTLHKFVGQPNYAGFRYGVNLNSISRSSVSNQIVTKLIVKSNKNKYAPNGFCAVGLAQSNPTKQNALFNFDNYVNTGLLDGNQLYLDLWDDVNGIGYYKAISQASIKYDEYTTKIEEINSILYPLNTQVEEAKVGQKSAAQKIQDAKEGCIKELKCEYEDFLKGMSLRYDPEYEPAADRLPFVDAGHLQAWCAFNNKNLKVTIHGNVREGWCESQTFYQKTHSTIASITELQNEYNNYSKVLDETDPTSPISLLNGYKAQIEELEAERATYVSVIESKDKEFYNKYYRYIQEGTWINESYVDHEKYYLDAVSTLYNSCQPQISYDVKVIDLAALEEYKGYECHLGDKTYIEDTEFFGYVLKNGIKTPYQEEIVITELTSVLDNPSKNVIKVQTKKTQFQDLFHRITATVQSVKFSTGAYDRAADMVTPELTLNTDFLQASFDKNAIKVSNAANETVEFGDAGITSTNKKSPNNIVRIISGGIYMSRDGGETWELGISPEDGINTHLLRAGQIDTSLIQIFDGASPSFRWDSNGINAYYLESYEGDLPDTTIYGYNYSKGVRFDRYGLYGFQDLDTENFNPQSSDDIMDDSHVKFALTWKGFVFRHNGGDNEGSILIGDLDGNGHYGIQINKDVEGSAVTVFNADESGDVSITGEIKANSGRLGVAGNCWTIGAGGLNYSGNNAAIKIAAPNILSDNVIEFKYNDNTKFAVDAQGNVIANGGTIGGCTIDGNGNLIIKNINVDSLNGIDIGKIRATQSSPSVSWPSEINASKIIITGTNGSSKIGNWHISGNKLYNRVTSLSDTQHTGICLDAGNDNDPSGINIYKDANNLLKFSTTEGLTVASNDINNTKQLYISNGEIGAQVIQIREIQSYAGMYTSGSTVLTISNNGFNETVTLNGYSFSPANDGASHYLGNVSNSWTTAYISQIIAGSISCPSVTSNFIPNINNTYTLGDIDHYWEKGYFTEIFGTVQGPSDRRLKQNINPVSERYLKLFDDIEIRSYEFIKENSKRTHVGVIAQDVESAALKNNIYRFAGVTHDEDADKYFVSYNDISMLHMAHYKNFLKSYEIEIENLKNEISTLKKEIQNLQKF